MLFDLDGTLLDSVSVILKAAEEAFGALSIAYDENELRKTIGIPLRVQAKRFAGARAEEFVERYRAIYRERQQRDLKLFPGTLQMLDAVKSRGFSTAVVTSKAARVTRMALDQTGIANKFDAVVTADDVQHPKPDPEPILKALEALKTTPEQAIYVGDSLFDVDAAQRAGVAMVGVSWGARTKDDLLLMCPQGVFDTWDEFFSWLDSQL